MAKKRKQINKPTEELESTEEILVEDSLVAAESPTMVEQPSLEEEVEQAAASDQINSANVELISNIPSKNYKFKKGDRVILTAEGNSKYDGTGVAISKKSGLKWVGAVVEGANYPYVVQTIEGRIVGYFKEDALSKI